MIQLIKDKVKHLYDNNQMIHLHIKAKKLKNKKQEFDVEAKIQGIYSSIFTVKECNVVNPKTYSFQYTELLIRDIAILEIGTFPEQPKIK